MTVVEKRHRDSPRGLSGFPRMINIGEIFVSRKRGSPNERVVQALKRSIQSEGQRHAITVFKREKGKLTRYALCAGLHRLKAVSSLGRTEILATIIDRRSARKWRLGENIIRNDPPPLKRAKRIVAYWKTVCGSQSDCEGGHQPHNKNVSRVAKELGLHRSAVQKALRYNDLPRAIKKQLKAKGDKCTAVLIDRVARASTDAERVKILSAKDNRSFCSEFVEPRISGDGTGGLMTGGVGRSRDGSNIDVQHFHRLVEAWKKSPISAMFKAAPKKVRVEFLDGLRPE